MDIEQLLTLSPDDVKAALAALSPDEAVELDAILAHSVGPWVHLPGPQGDARFSEADILGYGGAAGGGKTDLLCGLALVDHHMTTIFRNEVSQLESVKERLEEILRSRKGFNGQTNVWRIGKGRRIRFGGFPNPGDERRYQGSPNDLLEFDEAAEMRENAVRFVIGWNRSSKSTRRLRIVMTFNPPTTTEGRWILTYFGPWLDRHHPMYPTPFGELRWATTGPDGNDYWLTKGDEFVWEKRQPCYVFDRKATKKEDVIRPMSRTFIPARVADNPFLNRGEYLSRLQNFPEPLRSQMLHGDFEAGMKDDEWQVIPTDWVRASMQRWKDRGSMLSSYRPGPMDSMGVDVAMGGRDKFVIARRHGNWLADPVRYPGKAVINGGVGAGFVIKHRTDRAPVHVDVIGWGSATSEALISNEVQTIPINVSRGSEEKSKSGLKFGNLRAELVWRMREALDPSNPERIDLPDDALLEKDLTAYRYKMTRGGIMIESKEDMKKRLGYSPDDGDAYCLALIHTPKTEQMIDAVAEVLQTGYGGDYDRMSL